MNVVDQMFVHLTTIVCFLKYFPISLLVSKFGDDEVMVFPDFGISKKSLPVMVTFCASE